MARFWSHVKERKPGECWLFEGHIASHGYGVFAIKQGRIRAHRFAWLVSRGDIPRGKVVCHDCDTPACVNPAHLRLDTQAGNVRESVRKNRKRTWGVQKLNAEQVSDIRDRAARGERQKDIAAVYGISRNHVSSLVAGTSWRHTLEQRKRLRQPQASAPQLPHGSGDTSLRLGHLSRAASVGLVGERVSVETERGLEG